MSNPKQESRERPTPVRVQRKRTKGFNLQNESFAVNGLCCVYVGRPTKWGNPFWHVEKFHGRGLSLKLYAAMARGVWEPSILDGLPDFYVKQVYETHQKWLKQLQAHPLELIRTELCGKNLSCFCGLDSDCHADVLLRLANTQ